MEDKVYFNPGDIVKINHSELKNIPIMYVVEKLSRSFKKDGEFITVFKGIKCRWFDVNQVLHEEIFSSKDLEKY